MMGQTPFFVTGLPRSRSAWLANWLTTDATLCLHDTRFSRDLLRPGRRIGFAGPELVQEFERIRKVVPEAPWLIVWREPEEALRAFDRWAGKRLPPDRSAVRRLWESRVDALLDMGRQFGVKQVAFNTLHLEKTARWIWSWLLPGVDWDQARWEMLERLNVQQNLPEA